MVIGKVVDELVATQKVDSLFGQKLLLVQPLDLEGADWGEAVLAIDGADAGVDDRVLLAQDGYAAMHVMGRFNVPVEAAVVGVIDRVDIGV